MCFWFSCRTGIQEHAGQRTGAAGVDKGQDEPWQESGSNDIVQWTWLLPEDCGDHHRSLCPSLVSFSKWVEMCGKTGTELGEIWIEPFSHQLD